MAAILKIVKSPYLSEKLSDFVKTWYAASDIEPDDSLVTKNWNFYHSKKAAAAILKVAFLAIIHRTIVRFQQNFVWGSKTHVDTGCMTKTANF